MNVKISINPFQSQLIALQKEREKIEKNIVDFIGKHAIVRSVDFVLQDPLRMCSGENVELVSKSFNVEWNSPGIFFAEKFFADGNSLKIPAMNFNRDSEPLTLHIGDKINEVFVKKVITNNGNLLKLDPEYILESYDEEVFVRVKFDPPEDVNYIRWPRGRATARWIDFFDTEEDRDSLHKMLRELDENKRLEGVLKNTISSIKNFQTEVLSKAMVK